MILAKLLLLLAPWWQFVPTVPATPTSGGASIAFVDSASKDCPSAATACALTYSPTSGNKVYIEVWANNSVTVNSVTDNGSGGSCTYSQVAQSTNLATHYALALFTCASIKSSTTTVTANYSASASSVLIAMQFSGGAGTQDVVGTLASGTSTSAASGSVTPTAGKNELLLGYFSQNSSSTITFSAGTGYTGMVNKNETGTGTGIGMEYQIVASTSGSYTAGATLSASGNWWANIAGSY